MARKRRKSGKLAEYGLSFLILSVLTLGAFWGTYKISSNKPQFTTADAYATYTPTPSTKGTICYNNKLWYCPYSYYTSACTLAKDCTKLLNCTTCEGAVTTSPRCINGSGDTCLNITETPTPSPKPLITVCYSNKLWNCTSSTYSSTTCSLKKDCTKLYGCFGCEGGTTARCIDNYGSTCANITETPTPTPKSANVCYNSKIYSCTTPYYTSTTCTVVKDCKKYVNCVTCVGASGSADPAVCIQSSGATCGNTLATPTPKPTITPTVAPGTISCGVSNKCYIDRDCKTGLVCRKNQWGENMCMLSTKVSVCQSSTNWTNCCVQ